MQEFLACGCPETNYQYFLVISRNQNNCQMLLSQREILLFWLLLKDLTQIILS